MSLTDYYTNYYNNFIPELFFEKIFTYYRNLLHCQVMKRPGPGKLETLFGSEKAGPRALKPPTLGPPWPEEKSTKAPPLVTQVKIPPPNIVPHHKPPSNQVSTNPPTKIPKPPITPSPFHPNQQDPKKSQKKRVRKVLQVLYKVRALHPQFRGKCDEKNAKNRENSGQAQMHPTAITVMKNFKKKREEEKKLHWLE